MRVPRIAALILVFAASVIRAAEPAGVRAFPGAQGFGAATPGGRGGEILRVTTLAADGPGSLEPLPAAQVKEFVAQNVGARPWDRDPIDQRIVQAALEGRGKIIDSEQEVGGYPERPATRAPFKADDWDLETLERKR